MGRGRPKARSLFLSGAESRASTRRATTWCRCERSDKGAGLHPGSHTARAGAHTEALGGRDQVRASRSFTITAVKVAKGLTLALEPSIVTSRTCRSIYGDGVSERMTDIAIENGGIKLAASVYGVDRPDPILFLHGISLPPRHLGRNRFADVE
jgi:hypothetical protein